MQLSDFNYHLPQELIAQTPLEQRDHSRLLMLNASNGDISDKHFYDIVDMLKSWDVLVVNKTRVINARLKWSIERNGHPCEIFLHKQVSADSWDCLVYPGRRLKPGTTVIFDNFSPFLKGSTWSEAKGEGLKATIIWVSEYGKIVQFNKQWLEFLSIIDSIGQTPLPPYIKEQLEDADRYQTVYSHSQWSVAAPTAGLHFTQDILTRLKNKGIIIEEVTLHIWLGTFRNVEQDDITKHPMHSEEIFLEDAVAQRLNTYKQSGQKIIAVGTTSIRVLESFSDTHGRLTGGQTHTDIFIYPWYQWKFVDHLITNFHLPESTLLMLVSALAGSQNIKKAYEHAVDQKYRFFSFWDAMYIHSGDKK